MGSGWKASLMRRRRGCLPSLHSSFIRSALASTLLCSVLLRPAFAFEVFGYDISFGGIEKVSQDDPGTDVIDPVRYEATLEAPGDETITSVLDDASLLIAEQEKPASGTAGLLLRVRNDQKRLLAALYGLGRYGGVVDITINGRPFDDIQLDEEIGRSTPAKVDISVDPGPVFTFAEPRITLSDGSPIPVGDVGLVAGAVADSDIVLQAEDTLVARYRAQGYPFAQISQRSLEADHSTNTLDVVLQVDTGAQARLGAVEVSGAQDVDADFIIEQARIPQNALYSPKEVQDAAKRVRALGVFNSVIVRTGDEVAADGTVPVLIDVKERKPRTIGAGVTVGNLDGIGLEAFWTHRNLFGRAESLRVESSVSRIGQDQVSDIDYHGAIIFSKPGVLGPASTFESSLTADYTNPDAYHKRSIAGEVGLRYDFTEQLSGRVGVKTEFSRVTDSDGRRSSILTSLPLELSYDRRDSTLDPTEGFQILLEAEPTVSNRDSVRFLKASGTVSAYQALDEAKRFVLAGKLSAGSIIGASKSDIPADRRFYAGGGGSIRGYAYQAAGPRNADNEPTGGRSYVTASLEARAKVTDTIGVAVFADTGAAFNDVMPGSDGDWYTGVGAGVRYLTPVGPLRLDVAIPLNKIKDEPQYGIYLGLGQAF